MKDTRTTQQLIIEGMKIQRDAVADTQPAFRDSMDRVSALLSGENSEEAAANLSAMISAVSLFYVFSESKSRRIDDITAAMTVVQMTLDEQVKEAPVLGQA